MKFYVFVLGILICGFVGHSAAASVFSTSTPMASDFFSRFENSEKKYSALKIILQKIKFHEKKEHELSGKHALFIPIENSIFVNESLKSEQKIQRDLVLAHEIGHALAYNLVSPSKLAEMSYHLGPWKKASETELHETKKLGFAAPFFRKSHEERNDVEFRKRAPSRYALTNRMEWFAECFASWYLEKENEKGLENKGQKISLLEKNSLALQSELDALVH